MPLVKHMVKPAAVLVCVCDPLWPSMRFHLLDKPSPLTSDKQIQSAGKVRHPEHCVVAQTFTVVVVVHLTGLSSWWRGDNHDLLLTGVWHYVSSRLRQILLQSELPGWPCYSDWFGRSLSLQSHINGKREITKSEFLCSQGTWLQPCLLSSSQ